MLSGVSSDIIGIFGVISEIFLVINLLTSRSPLLTGVLSDFISFFKPEIQKIYQDIGVVENVKMKSSLKFCVVATGEYDGYVAEPRAYEWDIAAGHAILIHSGGTVTDFNGNEILYGKKDLKNPSLILKSKNIL